MRDLRLRQQGSPDLLCGVLFLATVQRVKVLGNRICTWFHFAYAVGLLLARAWVEWVTNGCHPGRNLVSLWECMRDAASVFPVSLWPLSLVDMRSWPE